MAKIKKKTAELAEENENFVQKRKRGRPEGSGRKVDSCVSLVSERKSMRLVYRKRGQDSS